MASKTYKVVTSKQETELVEADSMVLDEDKGRLNLFLGEDLVGSFIGYSSVCVHNPQAE
jgi:hypothetical protein